jgi:hypothetical protein
MAKKKISNMAEQIRTCMSMPVILHPGINCVHLLKVSSRERKRANGSTPVRGKRKFTGQAHLIGSKFKDDSPDEKGIVGLATSVE